jgi:hypothetical protein
MTRGDWTTFDKVPIGGCFSFPSLSDGGGRFYQWFIKLEPLSGCRFNACEVGKEHLRDRYGWNGFREVGYRCEVWYQPLVR